MPCNDPGCRLATAGDFYCRECGEMTHAMCTCWCYRATCPQCGHSFDPSLDIPANRAELGLDQR